MKEIGEYTTSYATATPADSIRLLEWASKNPSKAKNMVEKARKLNKIGKKRFTYYIFGSNYEPDEALKRAIRHQKWDSGRRRLITKIIVNAKHKGFFFKTMGGAECIVKKEVPSEYYTFNFSIEGVAVAVYHHRHNLVEFVKSLTEKDKEVFYYNIGKIVLDGKKYFCYKGPGREILQAIKENTNPFVFTVVKLAS